MAATVDLTIRRGDDESVTFTFTDKTTGNPINLTGRTYASQIRRSPNDSTVLASWVCAVTSAANGIMTMTLGSATTSTLTPGYAVWDLQETTSAGTVSTPLGGRIKIEADVTR